MKSKLNNTKNLLFFGDSITDAGHLWDSRREGLGNGFVWKIHERLDDTEYRCINKGQDGFTSNALLGLVRREVLPENLALITILIGVNDLSVWRYRDPAWIKEEFFQNVQEIIRLLRAEYQGKILLAEPFLFSRPAELLTMEAGLMEEHRILKAAAEKWKCDYLPLHDRFREVEREYGTDAVSEDGIHLTEFGNERLAAWWLEYYKLKLPIRIINSSTYDVICHNVGSLS